MKKIYFKTIDDTLIDNYKLAEIFRIICGKAIDPDDWLFIRTFAAKCDGIVKEIKKPSVRYLLKRGQKYRAIALYHDLHPDCTLAKAREIVEEMEKEMKEEKKFKVGDHVYVSDWFYGTIVCIDGDEAMCEFNTDRGGGTLSFKLSDLLKEEKC